MDKFDINSLGIVLALVGAVLAALLGGIGSAIGVGMKMCIRDRNEGDVEVVESTKYMIVLHRLPIKDDEDTLLESSDNRSQLLLELKNTEYADAVSAAAQSFEGVEWNQKVLNRYKPSMFADTKKNGTSSVASESSDESASSEESSAESSETSSETSETSSESSAE